jgi:molecular chaperone DnaK
VIGIDLGTTNCCVAVFENGQPTVIPNAGGYNTTPSVFAITEDGKRLVGHLAKRQAITNSRNTVTASKRLIGRRFDSPEVQRIIEYAPYEIVKGPNDDARVTLAGKAFTCPEIGGIILREMRRVAEEYLGEPVTDAVITVPAYFNDTQRQCTRDAGKIAGLEVLRIINEPTAAALAYGLQKKAAEEKIAVYDLGGGTFDISILEVSDGVVEVLATAGDTFLGGEDFDRRVVASLVERFLEQEGIDLRKDPMALQRLKDAAEKAKCDLSSRTTTEVNLPFIASDASGPRHLSLTLDRAMLEALVEDLVSQTLKIVEGCVTDAGLRSQEIDQVILVGGQTRMPRIQQEVGELFGKRPHKGVNPDEVVAVGAAIQGETLVTQDDKLIERNTTVPVRKSHIFTTTRNNQSAVKIRVLQGESDVAVENDLLGEFVLSGIRPAPKGEPEIEVCFDIDASGIVHVSARDQATGKAQSIQVNATGTLSEEEIHRIIEENQLYEVELKR